MPGQLHFLPTTQVAIDLLFGLDDLVLQVPYGSADIYVPLSFNLFDLLELVIEAFKGLLKFKKHHKLLIDKP